MTTDRLGALDALRGLAALSVCWFHLTNTYALDSLVRVSGSMGWLGVEVFFVISGFIIPYALDRANYRIETDWPRFMSKRILRIEPPYLIAVLLSLGLWHLSAVMPGYRGQQPDLGAWHILSHIGYLTEISGLPWLNPVFWSLSIEFQYYLLMSLTFWAWSSHREWIRFAATGLALASALLFPQKAFVFHWLPMFVLGIAAYQLKTNRIKIWGFVFISALAAPVVAYLDNVEAAVVTVASSWAVLVRIDNLPRLFMRLGTISFSLYLIHVPVGGRVVNLGRRFVDGALQEFLLSFVAMMICILASLMFYRLIERPSQDLASSVRYRRPASLSELKS